MILFIGFVLILFLYQGCFLVFTKHSIINLNKYYMLLTSLYMVSIFVLFFAYYSSVLNSFFKNFVFTNIILIYIFIVFVNHLIGLARLPFTLYKKQKMNRYEYRKNSLYVTSLFLLKNLFYIFFGFTLMRYYFNDYDLLALSFIITVMLVDDAIFYKITGLQYTTYSYTCCIRYLCYSIFLLLVYNFYSFGFLIISDTVYEYIQSLKRRVSNELKR